MKGFDQSPYEGHPHRVTEDDAAGEHHHSHEYHEQASNPSRKPSKVPSRVWPPQSPRRVQDASELSGSPAGTSSQATSLRGMPRLDLDNPLLPEIPEREIQSAQHSVNPEDESSRGPVPLVVLERPRDVYRQRRSTLHNPRFREEAKGMSGCCCLFLGVLVGVLGSALWWNREIIIAGLPAVLSKGQESNSEPEGYMVAPKLDLKDAVIPSAKYWGRVGYGLLWAMVLLCGIPIYKSSYRGGTRWWWLLIPVATLSLEFRGEFMKCFKWFCQPPPTPAEAMEFDWSRVVSEDGKLNIKVTTWNTFMLPLVALDQINRSTIGGFLLPQTKVAERAARFIRENDEMRNSDILLLQEVFSPGKNIFNNFVEGIWRFGGIPTYGRELMIQQLKEAGFVYVAGAKMPWWQSLYGYYDSGLIIASKIPFDNVKFTSYKSASALIGFGTCKGILSAEMPIKSPKGERIGTLLVGNTHTEYTTGAVEPGDEHPQYIPAKKHMFERVSETAGKVSCIMGGDWNTDNPMVGFQSTTQAHKAAGGNPESLYCNTDCPPTPVRDANGRKWGNAVMSPAEEFLRMKPPLPIEYSFEGCGAWSIDQIFGLDSTECQQRKAVMSDVRRVMMHFKDSTDVEKITENCLTWIRQWNETWIHEGEKGLNAALETAKQLHGKILSDHFPITTRVTVDYADSTGGTKKD